MYRALLLALAGFVAFGGPVAAQDRVTLGVSRFFTNDALGDGRDRWRTGSYSYTQLRGPAGIDTTALSFGQVMAYTARTEIIAPLSSVPSPGDRPYVGAITLSAHTHFGTAPYAYSLGVDLVATGPQTGLSEFQRRFHERWDLIPAAYTDVQLGDAFHIGASGEASRTYALSDAIRLRPFVQGQVGIETLARAGADVLIGAGWQSDIMVRDVVTGHIAPGLDRPQEPGLTFIAGGDVAYVAESIYLPEDRGFAAEDWRYRLRAGMAWQVAPETSVFYGLTYLGPEFVGQDEGQLTGTLQVNYRF